MKRTTANYLLQKLVDGSLVSFTYDGRPFPEGFTQKIVKESSVVFMHSDGLSFRLQFEEYMDTGAMEWTGWFENSSLKSSGAIRAVNILDITADCPAGKCNVGASRGTYGLINDFEYFTQTIFNEQNVLFKSNGSHDFMPFINVDTGLGGMIVGLGWTGNWFINVDQKKSKTQITSGMPDVDFYLHPGEHVRTPRILILPWEGEALNGHNLLRRQMINHHLPKGTEGQPQPQICLMTWGAMKTHNHLKLIQYVKDHGMKYDCYWMDAGWHGPDHDAEEYQNLNTEDWFHNQGDWRVNRVIHPDGLLPISEAAHEADMKFLLWCSAFNGISDIGWYKEHPEWGSLFDLTVGNKAAKLSILYMDDPDAVDFISEQIGNVLFDNGADYYREDTSLPLSHPDEEGRKGVNEMKAVENFYRYWDSLLEKNPGLIIDNCGGGGQRLDLETLSRSYCFWRSDYCCFPSADPIACQVGTYGLNYWSPFISGAITNMNNSTYVFRSCLGASMPFPMFKFIGYDFGETFPSDDFNIEWHSKMLDQYNQIKQYLCGDFYPLTGCDVSTDSYMAYQLDCPELQSGIILAFRRQDCGTERFTVKPILKEDMKYKLTDIDTGKTKIITGGMDYELVIQEKPGSTLIKYEKIK